jgi:hypothetical protein
MEILGSNIAVSVVKFGSSFVAIVTKEKIAEIQWNQHISRKFLI